MRLSWNEIRVRAAQFAQDWKDARYEEHVQRLDNSRGFIDLFWPGVLLVEQKSASVNFTTRWPLPAIRAMILSSSSSASFSVCSPMIPASLSHATFSSTF